MITKRFACKCGRCGAVYDTDLPDSTQIGDEVGHPCNEDRTGLAIVIGPPIVKPSAQEIEEYEQVGMVGENNDFRPSKVGFLSTQDIPLGTILYIRKERA